MWGTRAALAHMVPRKRGTIIQIGSALAYRSIPLQAAYCGAKHAIAGFTDSLRSELLHDRIPIDLCMVQLPAVNTPQFRWCVNKMDEMPQPVPPIFQPEIIAEALHRASLHPRREIYLGFPAIEAILGTQVAPGLADRCLRTGYRGQLTAEPNHHHRRTCSRRSPAITALTARSTIARDRETCSRASHPCSARRACAPASRSGWPRSRR